MKSSFNIEEYLSLKSPAYAYVMNKIRKNILNIYDYTDAMADLKVGEETEIVVKREEEELTLKLVPGSRD